MDHTTTQTQPATPRSARAFTLVELLVVIAVVGILIGTLLPALAGARESGFRTVSANNLRQVAILFNAYASDFDSEFPAVMPPLSQIDAEAVKMRRPPPEAIFQGQGYYGGFAGFFSADQENYAEGAYRYKTKRKVIWNRSQRRWITKTYTNATDITMPLELYIENWADLQMLQNPADKLDGGENGNSTPAVIPQTIKSQSDVVWHNISYLYIAGLNQRTPALGLLGDESNHCDWGNDTFTSNFQMSNLLGTLRGELTDPLKPGYNDKDNHGDDGGNFAFTDGHVEWIPQRFGLRLDGANPYKLGYDPNDKIFGEIQQFLSGGTGSVQTVD